MVLGLVQQTEIASEQRRFLAIVVSFVLKNMCFLWKQPTLNVGIPTISFWQNCLISHQSCCVLLSPSPLPVLPVTEPVFALIVLQDRVSHVSLNPGCGGPGGRNTFSNLSLGNGSWMPAPPHLPAEIAKITINTI